MIDGLLALALLLLIPVVLFSFVAWLITLATKRMGLSPWARALSIAACASCAAPCLFIQHGFAFVPAIVVLVGGDYRHVSLSSTLMSMAVVGTCTFAIALAAGPHKPAGE